MKIIVRVDTEDVETIKRFQDSTKEEVWTISQGDHIKIFVISDSGVVEEVK